MGKIVMRLHLPEPKVRKRAVRAVQKHKDRTSQNIHAEKGILRRTGRPLGNHA